MLTGEAEKDGKTIDFTLKIDREYKYTCGEYVGAERKGFLPEGGTADLEMTFHLDHLFGDAEASPDDSLNTGALGFDPLAGIAQDGRIDEDLAGLKSKLSTEDYQKLEGILPTLGHAGEAHCYCEQ